MFAGVNLRVVTCLLLAVALVEGGSAVLAQESSSGAKSSPAKSPAAKSFSATKSSDSGLVGGFYGNLELRHHLNTYYDDEGYLARREPSVHSRLQLGMRFYDNLIDAFLTLGIYKVPETQQVSQRRPELEVDVYPINNEYVTIQAYGIAQAPFSPGDQAPVDRETEDRIDAGDESEGTAVSLGLTPLLKYPLAAGSGKLVFKTGVDAWTKMYSRRQYTTVKPDEDDRDRLGLAPDESGEQEIEDYAQHYATEGMIGLGLWNANIPDLSADIGAFYETRFTPVYEKGEDSTDYHYDADRSSHFRFRLQYQWSPRITLVNDLFRFHEGRFGKLAEGEDRRFRNIARITCRL